ncbi:MAG: hypothetical protein H6611_09875 [Ignavibacteriales bacterium]|nr:hypothetical protein [Ignavibacteriales bacterium]
MKTKQVYDILKYIIEKDFKNNRDKESVIFRYQQIFKNLHITRQGGSGQAFYKWFDSIIDEFKMKY